MRTSWPHILIAIAAGYAVCFQIGKVPAALPLIADEFTLTLWQSGAIVSSLSVLTALSGIFVGLWANRYRAERTALLALSIAIVAGLAGSAADGFYMLLVARVFEGLGYILAMAALPAVVSANCAPKDRPLALAGWGSTVPGGIAVLMLSSPVLIEAGGLGWREIWIVTAVAISVIAALLYLKFRPIPRSADQAQPAPPLEDLTQALKPRTVALVALFILYSVQFLAVVSFLPTMIVEQSNYALGTAAFLGGIVAIGNAVGAVLAGPLITMGLGRRNIMMLGYAIMALAAAAVLFDVLPVPARIVAAVIFATVGALIPGTIWTYVPELARSPAQAPIFAGMFIQGSGIGQLVGPVMLGAIVDYFGSWQFAVIMTTTASVIGILLAYRSQPRSS